MRLLWWGRRAGKTRARNQMADGWCTGNWSDIFNWVHPRCTVLGVPHEAHHINDMPGLPKEE